MTSPGGRLPDFLIIGIMKSGSTTLYRWLGLHPEVWLPRTKEPEFFSDDEKWQRGVEWYSELFAPAPRGTIVGEASMSYTKPGTFDVAAARISETVSGARLIAIVRDPVARMRSHYRHEIQKGRERRSLLDALRSPQSVYVAQSCYHRVLTPYLRRVADGSLHLLRLEDLAGGDDEAWHAVLDYLGLRRIPRPREAFNVTEEKPRHSRLLRILADRGWTRHVDRVPPSVRRAMRRWFVTEPGDTSYAQQLAASKVAIPKELVAPVWRDLDRLESVLGRTLYDPEERSRSVMEAAE